MYSSEGSVEINVVEEKPFQASIEPPQQDALKAALDKDGHIALYINFDFAKATLKSDAQPVVEIVVKSGVAADRLKSAGYGASKPTADNASSEGRAKNRRVELVKL
ncbi:hypothetical protein ELE36_15370 [Pseudolysobacter antarcticus]|uniref:OmpA-like domain-containing protein n=1 Tax=Pseudolysobacter antarcticus TaxID=2511995 RepID=A0A411HM80_9GAMM|nr:hypothetical protein [Pseudolysobacter antarcticus]QBB71626.1 hypothetical protein ELE36_15370 [Pseudolysobacter antarcticus]